MARAFHTSGHTRAHPLRRGGREWPCAWDVGSSLMIRNNRRMASALMIGASTISLVTGMASYWTPARAQTNTNVSGSGDAGSGATPSAYNIAVGDAAGEFVT